MLISGATDWQRCAWQWTKLFCNLIYKIYSFDKTSLFRGSVTTVQIFGLAEWSDLKPQGLLQTEGCWVDGGCPGEDPGLKATPRTGTGPQTGSCKVWWREESKKKRSVKHMQPYSFTMCCLIALCRYCFFLDIEGLWQPCVKQVNQCHFSNRLRWWWAFFSNKVFLN